MKTVKKTLTLAASLLLAASANASLIINDEIRNIDGDLDGSLDDLLISQIQFDVAANTHILFDSLVWEKTGVDLNHDGELTGFDSYMRLFSGTTALHVNNNDPSYGTNNSIDNSVTYKDSVFDYTFASAGSYLLTIGHFYYSTSEALIGYDTNKFFSDAMKFTPYANSTPKDHGDWQVSFNVLSGDLSNVRLLNPVQANLPTAVPEPSSMMLFLLAALGITSTRTRKNQ
ncbi:hypothetical protein NBRC116592_09650 [Colwellia sp. KU-HH00111]|uniref:DVUA0089 family protein n=1 Tax=Colwellia sp. KU-HH00111 TaxID=3127652 RepID=UPI0031091A7B